MGGSDPYKILETALLKHLVGALAGDADRDIDGISTHRDPTGCYYFGTGRGLVDALAGQLEREDALRAINRKREASGLAPWSADSMRTAVHRARERLRELLLKPWD